MGRHYWLNWSTKNDGYYGVTTSRRSKAALGICITGRSLFVVGYGNRLVLNTEMAVCMKIACPLKLIKEEKEKQ